MSLKLLKKQAEQALRSIEIGKEYPTKWVLDRFDAASEKHQKDQVIGNMRSVLSKVASKQDYFSQKEITQLYDKLSNISGGNSEFRTELGDLLLEGYGKVAGPKKTDISKTAADMKAPISISDKSKLSDAFSVLFSFGSNDDSGLINKNLLKKAERLTSLELNALGIRPDMVSAVKSNEHFILCNAYFKNNDFTSSHVSIPVQISNDSVSIPSQVISGSDLVKLNKENVLVLLKSAQYEKKQKDMNKFAELRQYNVLETPKTKVPSALKEKLNISEEIILASAKYSADQIKLASSVVSNEVLSWGARAQVKFAGTNKKGLSFLVKTATSAGEKSFIVPVQVVNNKVAMPSEFLSDSNKFDFSQSGFSKFISGAKVANANFAFSRDTDDLAKLSYAELMSVVIDGVSKKDYRTSEDALSVVGSKFGPERYKIALEEFQKFIKISSSSMTDEVIKTAVKNGHLIKRSNSIEWYCPKLGLPLSKIAFDEKGRPIPKFRKEKIDLESIDGTVISTSKIVMS
jgi:hypothetical protein